MQFMIDVGNDGVPQLRAIATLINQACDEREQAAKEATERGPQRSPAEVFGNREALPEGFRTDVAPPPGTPTPPPPGTQLSPPAPPPAAPPPPVGNPDDYDSAGVKYDPNVHSSSRAKLKDGKWKMRRGGPSKTTAPPPMVPASPPPATAPPAAAPPPPPSDPYVAGIMSPPVTPTAAAPPPPSDPPPPPPPAGPTYRSLVAKITAAVQAGKMTHNRVKELCIAGGAPDLTTLNAMAHLIPTVDTLVDAELVGK